MALLSLTCPQCHEVTLFDGTGACVNTFNDGRICGFKLPYRLADGNSTYREKVRKHTNSPEPSFWANTGQQLSYVDTVEQYEENQRLVYESESVMLDPHNGFLFLWSTPSGANPIATLAVSDDSTTVTSASGVAMPLNSRPQNLHHRYTNHEPHYVPIAEGPDLTIAAPSDEHPHEYWVLQGDSRIYTWTGR